MAKPGGEGVYSGRILCTVILLVYSYYVDAPLRELANPGEPENPAKAPWYFLGLQEILVYFDPWIAGVVVPSIIIMGLMAIPYIDVNPKGNGGYCFWDRRFAVTVFLFGFIFLVSPYNSGYIHERAVLGIFLALGNMEF